MSPHHSISQRDTRSATTISMLNSARLNASFTPRLRRERYMLGIAPTNRAASASGGERKTTANAVGISDSEYECPSSPTSMSNAARSARACAMAIGMRIQAGADRSGSPGHGITNPPMTTIAVIPTTIIQAWVFGDRRPASRSGPAACRTEAVMGSLTQQPSWSRCDPS